MTHYCACMYTALFACLIACLLACLIACLLACLFRAADRICLFLVLFCMCVDILECVIERGREFFSLLWCDRSSNLSLIFLV